VREAKEETALDVELIEQFAVYSDPARDPRGPTLSVVFIARAQGAPRGGDDAADARVFPLTALPSPLCFDHARIIADYRRYRESGLRPRLVGRAGSAPAS
jgi:8-oxo-dGTP diphosphatase